MRQAPGKAGLKLSRVAAALLLLGVSWLAFSILIPTGPSVETFVDLPAGTSSDAMAARLADAGVIRSRFAFDILRLFKRGRLRAGEYRFDHPESMAAVYARLRRGDVYTRTVFVPEGSSLFDIAQAMAAAGLGTRDDFLAAARQHTELIAAWSPQATSLEGFLFPDTYRFSRHATEEQILNVMVRRFRQIAAQNGLLAPGVDVVRTVTMASLIEKEVNVDTERSLVAGVFENRLRLGMPLQTDPSVVYAAMLDGRWRGVIFRSDLQSGSPYNTYRHTGLPPGPICSPGLAALKAALAPAKTDYLYFVAGTSRESRFAVTLAQHEANVKLYRGGGRAQ